MNFHSVDSKSKSLSGYAVKPCLKTKNKISFQTQPLRYILVVFSFVKCPVFLSLP